MIIKINKKKMIAQKHHLIYENLEHRQQEETTFIFKGEHWLISNLQRRKYISKGFIKSLQLFILLNKHKVINLDNICQDH